MRARLLFAVLALPAVLPAQTNIPLPPAGSVSLPVDEYNRLVDLAGKPRKEAEAPPFDSVVKAAQINLRADGANVSGSIDLQGEVLAAGERKVRLVSGMTVLDAQQKGKALPLELEGGFHTALLAGPGEFAVSLETGIVLRLEPGRASFQLPAPAAGSVRLTLAVPGEQTVVNLSPGIITSHVSRDGQIVIEATLVPGTVAGLWWAVRLAAPPPAAPKETRFLSDVKTLISVSEAEVRVNALAEITVLEGEPDRFEVAVPEGYELTGATGASLLGGELQGNRVVLRIAQPSVRNHQFLVSLAKAAAGSNAEISLPGFSGTQRETGEVVVEGQGTMELKAAERGGMRRMDFKEASQYLLSMARSPVYAAFRYQRRPAETPAVALEWVRFPDSAVLSAVAQEAEVTTLVTSEGRSLTEVKLTLKNQSKPFLKVSLPAGASILSADVAGEKVKPAQGPDGARVPLLRAGFHPPDPYTISFVILHAGAPFEKKGGAELALPGMDIPVGLLRWEVFLPGRYKVTDFGGDALSESLMPLDREEALPPAPAPGIAMPTALPGSVGGTVKDPAGGVVPNVRVEALHVASGMTRTVFTDSLGRWVVAGLPSGDIRVKFECAGFSTTVLNVQYDASRGKRVPTTLNVGSNAMTVEVNAEVSTLQSSQSSQASAGPNRKAVQPDTAASANVADLQRRVAGVLPIAVNVPRTGNSYRFMRPLVVDEETTVTFRYKTR